MSSNPGDAALVRAVGFWALAASIVNITIGTSIFALPRSLAASMGPAAPIALVLGGLLFIPIVRCFAFAGSCVTATGGPYSYVDRSFGRLPGFVIAIMFWISNVTGSGGLSAALADQVALILPWVGQPIPRGLFLFSEYCLLAALNVWGVRVGVMAIIAFAAAKTIPLLLVVLAGIPHVHIENLRIEHLPAWTSVGASLVIIVFAYSGIETALAPSGEIRNPSIIVPKAALVGVAMVIGLYIGVQVIAQGVLGGSLSSTAAPLATVAGIIIPAGSLIMVSTAAISLVGSLQGEVMGSSRLLYALARDGFLPSSLATISERYRVPRRAILVHAAAGGLLACAGNFTALALVSGGAFCIVYIGVCAAAWRLQVLNVGSGPSMKMRGGSLIPVVGILGLLAILFTLRLGEWLAIGCTAVVACILYSARRSGRQS